MCRRILEIKSLIVLGRKRSIMSKVRNGPETDKFFKRRVHPKPQQRKAERAADPKKPKPQQRKAEHAADTKKPFDKKTYRIKKYSNKYKLDKWEENRRKTVLKKYYKDLKNDPKYGNYKPFDFDNAQMSASDDEEPEEESEAAPVVQKKPREAPEEEIKYVMHPDAMDTFRKKQKSKNQPFRRAQQELNRLRDEKNEIKEAAVTAKQERAAALASYKLKKSEKFKKLSKKTKTGQPLMKDRMQMLLENIQRIVK